MRTQPHPEDSWLELAKQVYQREFPLLLSRDSLFGPPMFRRDELVVCNRMAIQLMAAETDFMQSMERYLPAHNEQYPQVVATTFWTSELQIE